MALPENINELIRQHSKDDESYQQLLTLFNQQLHRELNDYRQRFDNHDAVQIIIEQGTGRIVDANPSAARFYGYPVEELTQLTVRDINTATLEEAQAEFKLAESQNRPFLRFKHRLASGDIRDVHVFSSPIHTSDGLFYHSIIVDVTDEYEAELRYRALFERSNDAVYIIALDGRYIDFNPQAAEMLGYTVDELRQLTPQDTIIREEHHQIDNVLERLTSGEKIPPYERTYICKDGTKIPGEINAQVIRDDSGGAIYIQAIVRDISQRKQMEQTTTAYLDDMKALQDIQLELGSIQNLEGLYRRMIELSHQRLGMERIALFRLEDQGDDEYITGTFGTDENGNVRDEAYYREIITPDHWTLSIRDAPQHTKVWDHSELMNDGQAVGHGWKIASTLWTGEESIGYLMVDNLISGRDQRPYERELISILGSTFGHLIERLETEQALYNTTITLQEIATGGNTGLWEWDLINNKVRYSAVWKRLIGYEDDEFEETHENFLSHIHPEDIAHLEERITASIAEKRKNEAVEFRLRHKDGSYRWILSQGSVYADDEGNPIRMLGTHVDITERKKIQTQEFKYALEQERLRLMTDFIQDAAHEFRTPLSTINSNAYLIRASNDKDYHVKKTNLIEEQVARIHRLVDMLLMMSRIESGYELTSTPVDLHSIITALSDQMRARSNNKPQLILDIPDQIPVIEGDVSYLNEALKQILDNAFRYTPENGSIRFEVNVIDDAIIIHIRDTGIGIEPEDIPKVFDTFWRKDTAHSSPGLGLGLPIARNIIHHHRGTVSVESQLNQGTHFKIKLPLGS